MSAQAQQLDTIEQVAKALFEAGWLGAIVMDADLVVRNLFGVAERMGPTGRGVGDVLPVLSGYEPMLRAAADGAPFFLPNVALVIDADHETPRFTLRSLPIAGGLLLSVEQNAALVSLQQEIMQARNDLLGVQRDLEKRQRHLSQANAWLDQFTTAISHDLRAPMRAIANCTPFLAKDIAAGASDEAADWTRDIEREARRGLSMIDGLLSVARLNEAGSDECAVHVPTLVDELATSLATDEDRTLVSEGRAATLQVN